MKITIDFDVPTPEMRRRFNGETFIDQTELEHLKSLASTSWNIFCLKAGEAVREEIEKM